MTKRKNNRPPNWAQLLLKHTRKRLDEDSKVDKSVEWGMLNCAEAGADAILEALKAKGYRVIAGRMDTALAFTDLGNGWLVFIEEAQDEN